MGTAAKEELTSGLKELKISKRVRQHNDDNNSGTTNARKAEVISKATVVLDAPKKCSTTNESIGNNEHDMKTESDLKLAEPLEAQSNKAASCPNIPETRVDEEQITNNKLESADSDPESDSDSSENWSTLPAIASYNIYDQDGALAIPARESSPSRSQGLQSTSPTRSRELDATKQKASIFGYTKVTGEEQAYRSHKTNQKTDFLFNHKALNKSSRSLNDSAATDELYDEYEEAEEHINDLTPVNQLSLTKNLLNDKEKFAYVGSVSVLINQMCTDLALTCLSTNLTGHKKLAQRLQKIQKSMGQWKTAILSRLFKHFDILPEEVQMIEKLTMHGVALEDICKCLKVSQLIDNPFEENDDLTKKDAIQKEGQNNPPPSNVIQPEDVKGKSELDIDIAWTIICDLFLLLLADSTYDSRSRTLLIRFAKILQISNTDICEFERRITDALDMEQSTEDQVWNETDHMKVRRKKNRKRKICYVGLATIGGSLVLGLSGGLLAPVIGAGIAAGLSTIGITGAAGFLTGVGGTAVVAATSTAIGAKIGTEAMSKRMGSVRTFEFSPLHNNRRVNLIVSVSGWMIGNEDDVRLPFSTVDPIEGDLYSLHWEPEMLKSTGQTINILASEIFTQTIQQILGATILTAFMSAIQMPMMLSKLGYLIDNPWNVSLDRAWSAGLILADTIMSRNLGQRPITLVGFSLGARVIYSCLRELCKRNACGLVENVFLFGTPVVYNRDELVMTRSVVSGRFVNGYSDKDWILCYLFRATSGGFKSVNGISPINGIEGIENFNCSDLVEGHMAYRKRMPKLLKEVGISVLSEEFADIEAAPDPEEVQRQRQLIHDLDEAQKKLSSKKKHNSWVPRWFKPKKAKWQEMCEETAMTQDVTTGQGESREGHADNALFNTSALLAELANIKQAIAEQAEDHPGSKFKEVPESISADDAPTDEGTDELRNSSNEITESETPRSPRKFQLLTAGRVVLPEDNYHFKKKQGEKVDFTFSDDF